MKHAENFSTSTHHRIRSLCIHPEENLGEVCAAQYMRALRYVLSHIASLLLSPLATGREVL